MRCPNCAQEATFTERSGTFLEEYNEVSIGEWLVCDLCGVETDDEELAECNRAAESDSVVRAGRVG